MQTELLIDCRQFDTPDSLHRYLADQLALKKGIVIKEDSKLAEFLEDYLS